MINDLVSDFLTRIRNALMMKHKSVKVCNSKVIVDLSNVLLKEGYIIAFNKIKNKKGKYFYLNLDLKYDENGKSMITGLKRVSKLGLRIYCSVKNLPLIRNGIGIAIVSTSRGVMSCKQAKKKKVGGELVCSVW